MSTKKTYSIFPFVTAQLEMFSQKDHLSQEFVKINLMGQSE